MEIKTTTKMVPTTVYTTSDGREFYTQPEAQRHELALERARIEELTGYVEVNSLNEWTENSDGVQGFCGVSFDGHLYLIKVDEKVIEWFHTHYHLGSDIECNLGKVVLIASYEDEAWVVGTPEDIAKEMYKEADRLKRYAEV